MRITRLRTILLFFCSWNVILLACSGEDPVPVNKVSQFIAASQGGTVTHPDGAELTVPPGALSRDTIVTIRNTGYHPTPPQRQLPLLTSSPRFSVDLGGAEAEGPLGWAMKWTDIDLLPDTPFDPALLALLASTEDGKIHVFPVESVEGLKRAGSAIDRTSELFWNHILGFELAWIIPSLERITGNLQVPFYTQDGLAWCEPTSITMLYNYHVGPIVGHTANWHVASLYNVPRDTSGVPPDGTLNASGAAGSYVGLYWDADMIPGAPFTDFVLNLINGFQIWVTSWLDAGGGEHGIQVTPTGQRADPRPVQATSSTPGGLHGYVIMAADENGIRVHDSSGALTGHHGLAGTLTWDQFRTTVAKPGDKDIWTAVLTLPVKPEPERRGSLVMRGGGTSSVFYDGLAHDDFWWRWDGAPPYDYGYFWESVTWCSYPDEELGCSFVVYDGIMPGEMIYQVEAANITETVQTYKLTVQLWKQDGGPLATHEHSLTTQPHTWAAAANIARGSFQVSQLVTSPGLYWIDFDLRQNNVVQDFRRLQFKTIAIAPGQ